LVAGRTFEDGWQTAALAPHPRLPTQNRCPGQARRGLGCDAEVLLHVRSGGVLDVVRLANRYFGNTVIAIRSRPTKRIEVIGVEGGWWNSDYPNITGVCSNSVIHINIIEINYK